MLVKDHVYTEPRQLIAEAAGLAIAGALDGICGNTGFSSILHPSNSVTMRIVEFHPGPGREDDRQIAW